MALYLGPSKFSNLFHALVHRNFNRQPVYLCSSVCGRPLRPVLAACPSSTFISLGFHWFSAAPPALPTFPLQTRAWFFGRHRWLFGVCRRRLRNAALAGTGKSNRIARRRSWLPPPPPRPTPVFSGRAPPSTESGITICVVWFHSFSSVNDSVSIQIKKTPWNDVRLPKRNYSATNIGSIHCWAIV